MGARLSVLALRPRILQQGTEKHKLVFAAADMRQQEFHDQVSRQRLGVVSVLLASSHDKALKWSQRAHAGHIPLLLDECNMDGPGSRAGYCEASLCCHQTAFTTVDCSAATCRDKDRHDYICTSPAVIQCLTRLSSNTNEAWDIAPEVTMTQVMKEENNNGFSQILQVKTLHEL